VFRHGNTFAMMTGYRCSQEEVKSRMNALKPLVTRGGRNRQRREDRAMSPRAYWRRGFCLFGLLGLFVGGLASADTPNARSFTAAVFTERLAQSPVFTVAVLPMENMAVHDPAMSQVFRMRILSVLRSKGYAVVEPQRLDQALQQLGLSHAGQLNRLSFEQLGAITAADGFLSGAVEESGSEHQLVSNSYVFTASLKLQDRSGENLWYGLQERVAKARFAIDPLNMLLDALLIAEGGNADQAMQALADRLMKQFPPGPIQMVFDDPLLQRASEITATPQR
jgi:hypothetical protein